MNETNEELRARVEQLEVQLAGCGAAALGAIEPRIAEAKPGDYGWSRSYGDVVALRRRVEAMDVPPVAKNLNPIDVAVGALSEHASSLLAGIRPNRFAELQVVMRVVQAVQRLKPPEVAGVADMGLGVDFADDDGDDVMPRRGVRMMRPWNDGADMQAQLLMMAQNFLKEYTSIEKSKVKPDLDIRLGVVSELAELMMLRMKLLGATEAVPDEINQRIDTLLKRIGEPPPTVAPEENTHDLSLSPSIE